MIQEDALPCNVLTVACEHVNCGGPGPPPTPTHVRTDARTYTHRQKQMNKQRNILAHKFTHFNSLPHPHSAHHTPLLSESPLLVLILAR